MPLDLIPDLSALQLPPEHEVASPSRANNARSRGADSQGVTPFRRPAPTHRMGRARVRAISTATALTLVAAGVLAAAMAPANATVRTTTVRTAVTNTAPTAVPAAARATATTASTAAETPRHHLARLVNLSRTMRGLKPYTVSSALGTVAQQQAQRMANQQRLFHNPNLTTDVHVWKSIGENVAYTSTVSRAHQLLMASPPHRANLLSTRFNQVGVGVVKDSHGTVWVVEVFRQV